MKPKEVICPICGEEMIPGSWGMKRVNQYPSTDIMNYIDYECSCGCTLRYIGRKNCWSD